MKDVLDIFIENENNVMMTEDIEDFTALLSSPCGCGGKTGIPCSDDRDWDEESLSDLITNLA